MAVANVGATPENMASGTSWVVTKPGWVSDGHMMIVGLGSDSVHTISAIPSGWAQIQSTIGTGSDDSSLSIFWKIASSEGSSWTWTMGGSESGAAMTIGYSGHNGGTPESVAGTRPGSSTSQAAPAITPSANNAMVLAMYGCDPAGAPTGSPDTAPTPDAVERIDHANSGLQHLYAQDYLQTTAASLSLVATMSAADTYCNISIAILEAGGAATPQVLYTKPPPIYLSF